MEESQNKTEIKPLENENKNLENEEKTLLNENKEENNDFPSFLENDLESENKAAQEDEKTELEKFLEKEGFDATETIENFEDLDLDGEDVAADGEGEEDEDLDFDPNELDDISEGGDPFGDLVDKEENTEPKTKTVDELKDKLASSKSQKIMDKATLLALGKVDLVKAKLCSKISGQHFMQYIGSEDEIELFIAAFKEYLKVKEFKEPSPFVALMFTLGMWTLPPLGMALLERFEIFGLFGEKNKEQQNNTSTHLNQEQEARGEAASDQPKPYAHLKEFQEQRRKFFVNASGKYNHTPNGKKYIPVDLADEYPSPIIQEWIEAGKKNKEIIKLLDYGE